MERESNMVVVGAGSAAISPSLLRQLSGPAFFGSGTDKRFLLLVLVSLALHAGLAGYMSRVTLAAVETSAIEKIPERFARLIIEKPIPKPKKGEKAAQQKTSEATEKTETDEKETTATKSKPTTKEKKAAQKRVARRVARVEKKIRTVGVLGILTGKGATARGPAVRDVLKGSRTERNQDLEAALKNMTGIVRGKKEDIVNLKLVKTKDLTVARRENIDHLIAGIGTAKTKTIAKSGNFVIQRPESIEGAGGNSAKRDNDAINSVVGKHKVSIRMSYQRYLQQDPSLSGKITVQFTIASSGSVIRVTILENTTGNSAFEREIVRKVKMWKFEPIPEGDATVTYPFVFTPA